MATHRITVALLLGVVFDLCAFYVHADDGVQWAWLGGSFYNDRLGVYGERGIPSITNKPGARSEAVGWYDSTNGELWVFGGVGYTNNYLGSKSFLLHYTPLFSLINTLLDRKVKRFVAISDERFNLDLALW